MPRRVSWGIEDPNAGDNVVAGLYHFDLILDGRVGLLRPDGKRMHLLWQLGENVLVHPKVPLRCTRVIGGVWKTERAFCAAYSRNMIGMTMSDHNLGDGSCVDTCC